jgi:serine/threonine-protein kinase PpkA
VLARNLVAANYLAVRNGTADQFGKDLERVRTALVAEINRVVSNAQAPPAPTSDPFQDAIAQNFHAMRLKYLGRTQGVRPPSMFEAFIAERDLTEPYGSAMEMRVFLTKNELSTMHDAVGRIVTTAESTLGDPGAFFTQLQGAIGRVLNNPSQQVDTLGIELDDLLNGLPYLSPVLSVDRQTWVRMGAGGQNQMRMELDAKLAFAKDWLNTPGNWIALRNGIPDGEMVTLYPLSQLP